MAMQAKINIVLRSFNREHWIISTEQLMVMMVMMMTILMMMMIMMMMMSTLEDLSRAKIVHIRRFIAAKMIHIRRHSRDKFQSLILVSL